MNTKRKCQDDIFDYELSEEGSIKFLEQLKKPNPKAIETLRRGREMLTDEQISKIGLERVRVKTRVKLNTEIKYGPVAQPGRAAEW